jgi:hypothetical protein
MAFDPNQPNSSPSQQPVPPTQPMGMPPVDPSAAPKKSNMLIKAGVGCLSLLVLACVGFGALVWYQDRQQKQNYAQGHEAYLQADCASAMEPLSKAANGEPGSSTSDVAVLARSELAECDAFHALAANGTDDLSTTLFAYSDFLNLYPASPLLAPALAQAQELVASSDPNDLVSGDLCTSIDSFIDNQIIATPDQTVPELLFACGNGYEAAEMPSEALDMYYRFRTDYPDHALAADVEEAFARASVAEAAAFGAGTLPPPQQMGEGTGEGNAIVIIQNDSPDQLSLVFSGPEALIEEVEACTDCVEFSESTVPDACPELGPVATFEVPPGDYSVVVKSVSSDGVTPFIGSWSLAPGQEYSSCFYLITSN